ncbi:bifunctional tRNA (5-methylaminomethyl-2-thiouridine)(34)-methyltransferase MnmD/FAD-dependent 5-carboxymethylaminomethyl-2-thiouridine(34) oxidoreductase MnmC [Pseudogulbenkiania sp. MAI-1]|uniref:bifunctional tRNA (5-methylaminomethyl-2-thiouridine)(34)-methyltransferase MnmD/FAD-dependent 5-carboxymethylaminomethyl-2-thiouridine(34) oxidoreductase MnmC n=1 Tax=Pseudogulbenkiania sp. MAI-1 TaxID=990370 RepID=UPI00045E967D|nr:bifunctional tRNA (5-methylaminomethyl-2-thiouridine)(34)-methyltransferase MnmD/FAD-dependent 5-carboxymethylaminomethyl-2-thiouridine(34) oxidoreductase MnmC [Pseudogulbenkiania sp. MAI-1]
MTHHAQLDWQDGQPFSRTFGDVYFSRASGLEETRHVFLHHNALAERFAALPEHGQFCIGETGFGTGLNVLCAWQCFEQYAPATARLHVVSTEKFPLTPDDLRQALALWPELTPYSDELLAQYDILTPGWHRFVLRGGRVTLTLLVGDALETLPELDARVDAWFLDGFAPAKNPEMWQPALFEQMARLSAPGATFATFTSAGAVRRGLIAAGFAVEKVPGYGHKREMCRGRLEHAPEPGWQAPWFARPATVLAERSAIVIGGGIAGAASAASLARRGWQVSLLDRHRALAQEASGNPQGVLYAKLSPHFTPLTRLVLAGYGYSLRTLHSELPQSEANWQACGVLQLPHEGDSPQKQAELAAAGLPDGFLRQVDRHEASELAGLDLPSGGLFFPQAGWLNPARLIARLTDHANIRRVVGATALELAWNPAERLWTAYGQDGPLAVGAVVVIAGGADAAAFDATHHLPLKRIRGQVTVAPATAESRRLKTVLCGEGYIAPARYDSHCLGATFKFNTDDLSVQPGEHRENLAMLSGLCPELYQALGGEQLPDEALGGRAAFRCTSPDYLPIVGPVVDRAAFLERYRALGQDATRRLDAPAPWVEGLYVNTAHGSRGMITAPLSGEILAAYLEGEPAPLPKPLLDAIHPSRFLLRDLIRQKIKP